VTQLYRHFDKNGKLLYVGVSICALVRFSSHKSSPWILEIVRIEIQNCGSRSEAEKLERLAIKMEKPKYNRSYGIELIQYERKRGRPRLEEVRSKPWLNCDPPMSKTTWYRRLREKQEFRRERS
jgi:excinuclease UvrABC nuclease subunit